MAAVARDQLQYAVAELSTHDNQRVTKALNDGLQAALTGTKTPAQVSVDQRVLKLDEPFCLARIPGLHAIAAQFVDMLRQQAEVHGQCGSSKQELASKQ